MTSPPSPPPPPTTHRQVTMTELMGLRRSSPSSSSSPCEVVRFESVFPLAEVGGWSDLAYGGGMLAMAINAASQTLDGAKANSMALYSVVGHFLGGANRFTTLQLDVTRIRDTRTFATRQVMLWQQQQRDDGQRRNCFSLQIDFVDTQQQNRTLLQHHAAPRVDVTHHSQLREWHDELDERVKSGTLSRHARAQQSDALGHMARHCASKYPPESVAWHNIDGVTPQASTPQDALPITQKALFEWFRTRFPIELNTATHDGQRVLMPPTQRIASAAFLAFHLDGYLPMAPVVMARMPVFSAEVALSLELALRFPINELDASKWHLRQIVTIASAHERTLGETTCWQEADDGRLLLAAHMTQATVLRKKANL